METTKKSSKKGSNTSADKIQSAYIEHLLTHGKQPTSVFKFCLDLGMKEEEFYQFFGSFEGVEKHIWKGFIDKTINRLRADKSFNDFSAREKILAFYFTLLEELKLNRSLIIFQLHNFKKLELVPTFLKDFKASFEEFIASILVDGKSRGEVATRPYLDKQYPALFWFHLGFVLLFWKDDDSAGFEKTDAAVEKSVNLAFDLIGKGALDTAIDFAKFLYQTKK